MIAVRTPSSVSLYPLLRAAQYHPLRTAAVTRVEEPMVQCVANVGDRMKHMSSNHDRYTR